MTVAGNVAFGLEQEKLARAEIERRVAEILDIVKLSEYAKRKPHQLSGGQRQRVALARSLVKRPKLLLLDEPLGALDRKLREHTQFELLSIQEKLGVTFVVVTHDQEEAMTLSSRVGVMNRGEIVQVGTPRQIYEFPASRFVADFIGSVNLFEGQLTEDEQDHVRVHCEELGAPVYVDHGMSAPPLALCWVAVRPEKIVLSARTSRPAPTTGRTARFTTLPTSATCRCSSSSSIRGGKCVSRRPTAPASPTSSSCWDEAGIPDLGRLQPGGGPELT